jgi:hypothetical protein
MPGEPRASRVPGFSVRGDSHRKTRDRVCNGVSQTSRRSGSVVPGPSSWSAIREASEAETLPEGGCALDESSLVAAPMTGLSWPRGTGRHRGSVTAEEVEKPEPLRSFAVGLRGRSNPLLHTPSPDRVERDPRKTEEGDGAGNQVLHRTLASPWPTFRPMLLRVIGTLCQHPKRRSAAD